MALTRKLMSNRSKQVRSQPDGTKQGCGDDKHMLVGALGKGDDEWRHRSFVDFAMNWNGVQRLIKAEIAVKTETGSTHFSYGSRPKVRVQRCTGTWTEGSNNENVWTPGEYTNPTTTGAVDRDIPINPATGDAQDETWVFIDVTSLIQPIAPDTVTMPNGSVGGWKAGKPSPNRGWMFRSPDSKQTDNAMRAIFHAYDRSGSTNDPYMLLTFDPPNQAPTAPTTSSPPESGPVGFGDRFEGQHHDPENDPMSARLIRVWVYPHVPGTKPAWELPSELQTAGSNEVQTGTFSVPLSLAADVLKLQTDYTWDAATKDAGGLLGPYSAQRTLRITSSVPNPPVPSSPASVADLSTAKFGGTYGDTEGNPLSMFELQMQALSGHTDAAFSDPNAFVWDTGQALPTAKEVTERAISRDYVGRALGIGTYTYRIRMRDSTGQWSVWAYADWTLTQPYNPAIGETPLVTQLSRDAPVRIALFKMGALRGPGDLIGYLDDPVDVGASAYLNGGGEVYFSLPALHPYCPSIEPHRVHYQVQQYYGDRYRPLFAGLITDFDADTENVTYYGTDYLGLLQTAVDERYNTSNAEEPANGSGGGGSKYVNQPLDYIVKDQLRYHKNATNSPVGFITEGPITALAERATIYSTYSEALPFITGIIDSHKQGTGREIRFYARPKDATFKNWEWALVDNWGRDRKNIRLEYGGLVNDFRVVALGDFGTRVLAIGQKRGEVKVYRAVSDAAVSGLDEAHWGRRAKTAFFQDINDQNDLQRRANEGASALAKIGKRMALALRADMLAPFDGWDLGDSIEVDIERGVVYTPGYGSLGLWTIYGVEWRYNRDGHTDLTLTVLPKKTAGTGRPDLIPSVNPGLPVEWQTGFGVPTLFGLPPSATPPPETGLLFAQVQNEAVGRTGELPLSDEPVIGERYQDLNTGCVYEVDPVTAEYGVVYCPPSGGGPAGPAGPAGPVGPIGPPGADATRDMSPPPTPEFRSIGAPAMQDGVVTISGTVGYGSLPGIDDLAEYVVQSTRFVLTLDPTSPDWTRATQWTVRSLKDDMTVDNEGAFASPFNQPNALPGAKYWLRVAAVDTSNNRSGWSTPAVTILAGDDLVGPPQPSGAVPIPGHTSFGLHWSPILAEDYDYVEVQWKLTTDTEWVNSVRVAGTMVIVTGVQNSTAEVPISYDIRLRSVDTSGNTADVAGSVKVDALGSENRGWVSPTPATVSPSALAGDSLHWTPQMFTELFANAIVADWVTSGTLRAGKAPVIDWSDPLHPKWPDGTEVVINNDVQIEVWNADGLRTGTWGPTGITLVNPADPEDPAGHPGKPGYKMELTEDGLFVWANMDKPGEEYKIVSITPLGIDAESITFGSARGGHNLIQNSSFEMGSFAATAVTPNKWDLTADFNTTRNPPGSDINITVVGGTTLQMASVT